MAKRGRPVTKSTMSDRVFFRLSREDGEKLDNLAVESGMNKSEVVREALRMLYEKKNRER